MRLASWIAPGGGEELALHLGPDDSTVRLLVLPAWFDEDGGLRHFTVEVLRLLAADGVASVLPDLPGCNESLTPLEGQTLDGWCEAALAAAQAHRATHVLTIRAGAALATALPGWAYAPLAGKAALRRLLRAQAMAAKEAGQPESAEALLERGKAAGVTLAGWTMGPRLVSDLAGLDLATGDLAVIAQEQLGGPGLWLRAEPEHDPAQAERLARIILTDLAR